MECYPHLLSSNKFLSPSDHFLLSCFSRETAHGPRSRDDPYFFKEIPQTHRRRFLLESEQVPTKIACMVPRETYRFTSKPFDMYARRRPLVSELFTGVSKIGTRTCSSASPFPARRRRAKIVTSRPRRIPRDFNSTDAIPPRRSLRRVVALYIPPPLVGRRVPCPTRVDNVSLAGHGTIRRQVTHRAIGNFPKPSTATG